MQSTNITLGRVSDAFKLWRSDKLFVSEPIPDHLKNLVKQLIPRYPKSQILKGLKISYAMFSSIKTSGKNKSNNYHIATESSNSDSFRGVSEGQISFIPVELIESSPSPDISVSSASNINSISNLEPSIQEPNIGPLLHKASLESNDTESPDKSQDYFCEIINSSSGARLIVRARDITPIIQAFLCCS
jgi:hypothetical protein